MAGALFAPWVAPHNPFDLRTLNLMDALTPPAWEEGGNSSYPLGTDLSMLESFYNLATSTFTR